MPTIEQNITSTDAAPQHAALESLPIKPTPVDLRHVLVFGGLATILLLWVAIYNGYPTVLPDSGNYLSVGAFHIALAPFRAPGYAVFTHWSSFGISAWFIVVTQAIIVVYVLHESCAHLV